MNKKLITTLSLGFALATAAGPSTVLAQPNNNSPDSPGACNMLNAQNGEGYNGMFKSASPDGQHPDPYGAGPGQGVDLLPIMFPLAINSEDAGCTPANDAP